MNETKEPPVLDQPLATEVIVPEQVPEQIEPIVVHGEGEQPTVDIPPLEPEIQAKIEEEFQAPNEVNDAELVEAHGMELPNYGEVLQEAGDQQVEAHHQSELMAGWVDEQDPRSQQDFELYLARRPFQDSDGRARTADGKFLDAKSERIADQIAQEEGEQFTSREEYEEMGMVHLAQLIGRAESEEDRTMVQDINDILLGKLEGKVKDSGLNSEQVAKFYDRLMKVKDTYRELWPQLKANSEKEAYEKNISAQRDRVDPIKAERVLNGLKSVGIDDEALQNIPAEQLYNQDDPDYVENKNEEIVEILEKHQSAVDKANAKEQKDTNEPDQDTTDSQEDEPKGVLSRIRDRLQRAKEAVIGVHSAYVTGEWRVDDAQKERSDRRRRVIIGAIGGVATVVAGYALIKGVSTGGGGSVKTIHELDVSGASDVASTLSNKASQAQAVQEAVGGTMAQNTMETLGQSGDTISDHALAILSRSGNRPTDAQIWEETQRILALNNLTADDAKQLPIGYQFKV